MTAAPPAVSAGTIFAPVRSQTAFEETLERLGTAIKLGLLPPGERLPAERELCRQLGISRSTLRQALTALVQSGHLHAARVELDAFQSAVTDWERFRGFERL